MTSTDLVQRSTVDAVLELAALDNRDWNGVLQAILRVDSHTLAIDRTSYWKLCEQPRMIRCELGYVRSADAFEQGATLLETDAGSYIRELEHAAQRSREPDIAETGGRILRQSRRLTRLVSRMLDASLAERRTLLVQPHEVDLVPLVREVVDEFAFSIRGATITVALPASVVGRWDGDRLQEVVSNLLDNALKYGSAQPIDVTLAVEGDCAVLTIVDHGIGIDADVLPKLLAPYERGALALGYGGLGLGLFISRQIVEAHGGSLELSSQKDVGSEFRVRLPGVESIQRDSLPAPGLAG